MPGIWLTLALQALDDLLRGVLAVVAALEVDLDAAGVERGVGVVDADVAGERDDVRVLEDGVRDLLLAVGHGGE